MAGLASAFTSFLGRFEPWFKRRDTFADLGIYCWGLAGDLPRKSVEQTMLAGGTVARTQRELPEDYNWNHDGLLP